MSIRETVHHLFEASLGASNIILAALAKSGSTYDWMGVTADALQRTVQLYDAHGASRYTKTVRKILSDEADHAREHLEALPQRRVRSGGVRGRRTRG